jgi:hypothetical protein
MRIRLLFAAALAALLLPASAALVDAPAQKNKPPSEEERLIRTLIAKLDAGERVRNSPDSIFASGSTPRPLVGTREQQRFSRGAGKELQQSRPNAKTQTNVRRLVVASSGDLAYEFSGFVTEWDAASGPAGFHGSLLRVWRKDDGEWAQEAMFMRPDRR